MHLLSRHEYAYRYSDLTQQFGHSKSELCFIANEVMRNVSYTHGRLLETFDQWRSMQILSGYSLIEKYDGVM